MRPATHQVDDVLQEIRIRVEKNERVLITTLTKRMAEQLTDYLADNGVKVRYLHSDIDTVERVEILRDLRLGSFDVLVGINLLREGLDIPEVSLVAILDADKEGFLRAERSLIQTIGRAARHLNGQAILYADRMTESMKKAIGETERRRAKQIAHNELHGITPRSIVKQVRDLIDGVYSEKASKEMEKQELQRAMTEDMSEKDVAKEIKRLEKLMLEHARNLEFEKAARVRDQLALLKEQAFGAVVHDNVVVPIQRAPRRRVSRSVPPSPGRYYPSKSIGFSGILDEISQEQSKQLNKVNGSSHWRGFGAEPGTWAETDSRSWASGANEG